MKLSLYSITYHYISMHCIRYVICHSCKMLKTGKCTLKMFEKYLNVTLKSAGTLNLNVNILLVLHCSLPFLSWFIASSGVERNSLGLGQWSKQRCLLTGVKYVVFEL